MNNKKKVWYLLIFLIISVGLVGCGIKETTYRPANENAAGENQQNMSGIDHAYETILQESSQAFIGYHLIDESFLSWIVKDYGVEAVENIAEQVSSQNAEVWYEVTGKSIHVLWYEYCRGIGYQSYSLNRVYEKECASEDEIVLDFTGDLTLADNVATTNYFMGQPNGLKDAMSQTLLEHMNQADILTINNEFAYTNRGEPLAGKAYTFRADPARVSQLNYLGVDLVSLANNHVWDYGEIGVTDTLDTLHIAGIPYVGAGVDLEEASQPTYFIANGKKIAIVSATQIERSYTYTKEATESRAGVLKTLNPDKYVKVIETARKNADYVIAVVHWGTEGNAYYGGDQRELAQAFVDAGADVIVGGHTHCLQGMEYIDDVPVYYSLGNFYFSSTGNMPAAYDTGVAEVVISRTGDITVKFIPCRFSQGVTKLLEDAGEKQRILNRLEELSDGVTIDESGVITQN